MGNCATCRFALFDEKWGEYKCSKLELYVYNIEIMTDCENYQKGNPGVSKDIPEKK